MTEFSPGLAQAAFDMLQMLGTQPLCVADVVEGLRRIGGMPAAQVLSLAQRLNWVAVVEDGRLEPTPGGRKVIGQPAYPLMLRQAVLDFADVASPAWLQNARLGRARVMAFAAPDILQTLIEAEVSESVSEDVVAFWDKLAGLARGRRDDRLTEIGRGGERLSISHEAARTSRMPRWVAIDCNEDGFDLLSIRAADDPAPLGIEVKASTQGLAGSFFVTRNEWEVASSMEAHVFHLWDLSQPPAKRLAVVSPEAVLAHVPSDTGEGEWSAVEIPFSAFTANFTAPVSA